MLCFSDKWSVLGHFNRLDNKLVMKLSVYCLDQIFWTYGVGPVISWLLVYSQVVSMKISSEISILSFLTLFSGWTLFACSFWQCLLQFVISLGIVIKKDNNVIMISYLCNAQLILSVRQEILSFVFVFTLVKFRKLIIMMINC